LPKVLPSEDPHIEHKKTMFKDDIPPLGVECFPLPVESTVHPFWSECLWPSWPLQSCAAIARYSIKSSKKQLLFDLTEAHLQKLKRKGLLLKGKGTAKK
jgi:hypothetical protein